MGASVTNLTRLYELCQNIGVVKDFNFISAMRIFEGGGNKNKSENAAKKLCCLGLKVVGHYSPLCLFLLATLGTPQ